MCCACVTRHSKFYIIIRSVLFYDYDRRYVLPGTYSCDKQLRDVLTVKINWNQVMGGSVLLQDSRMK